MKKSQESQNSKKTWSDAFKDPKVLVVLISLLVSVSGGAVTMLIQFGSLDAKVQILQDTVHKYELKEKAHENNIADMNTIINSLALKCGAVSAVGTVEAGDL